MASKPECKRKLTKNFISIKHVISENINEITDTLIQEEVIKFDVKDKLRVIQLLDEQAEFLFKHLLIGGPLVYTLFLNILRVQGHDELVDKIEETELDENLNDGPARDKTFVVKTNISTSMVEIPATQFETMMRNVAEGIENLKKQQEHFKEEMKEEFVKVTTEVKQMKTDENKQVELQESNDKLEKLQKEYTRLQDCNGKLRTQANSDFEKKRELQKEIRHLTTENERNETLLKEQITLLKENQKTLLQEIDDLHTKYDDIDGNMESMRLTNEKLMSSIELDSAKSKALADQLTKHLNEIDLLEDQLFQEKEHNKELDQAIILLRMEAEHYRIKLNQNRPGRTTVGASVLTVQQRKKQKLNKDKSVY